MRLPNLAGTGSETHLLDLGPRAVPSDDRLLRCTRANQLEGVIGDPRRREIHAARWDNAPLIRLDILYICSW